MRLIDSDEYLKSIRPKGIADELWTASEAYLSIMRMPPVDAVPVSWIMAQVAERKGRGTAFDLSVASILRTMVKEWRDEQTD